MMKLTEKLLPLFVMVVLLIGVGTIAVRWFWPGDAAGAGVTIPEFSTLAARGKIAFDANCAQCHGRNATGTEKGPPFINRIYNPGHHGDEAFFLAARQGVRQHHWPFGNMPPQPQVTDEDLAAIVRYVRELQEADGIFYQPHTM